MFSYGVPWRSGRADRQAGRPAGWTERPAGRASGADGGPPGAAGRAGRAAGRAGGRSNRQDGRSGRPGGRTGGWNGRAVAGEKRTPIIIYAVKCSLPRYTVCRLTADGRHFQKNGRMSDVVCCLPQEDTFKLRVQWLDPLQWEDATEAHRGEVPPQANPEEDSDKHLGCTGAKTVARCGYAGAATCVVAKQLDGRFRRGADWVQHEVQQSLRCNEKAPAYWAGLSIPKTPSPLQPEPLRLIFSLAEKHNAAWPMLFEQIRGGALDLVLYLKWRGSRQANSEEAYLRASLVAGEFPLPPDWLAQLPVEKLLPGLRKIVRWWETHAWVARRQRERADRYARERSPASESAEDKEWDGVKPGRSAEQLRPERGSKGHIPPASNCGTDTDSTEGGEQRHRKPSLWMPFCRVITPGARVGSACCGFPRSEGMPSVPDRRCCCQTKDLYAPGPLALGWRCRPRDAGELAASKKPHVRTQGWPAVALPPCVPQSPPTAAAVGQATAPAA
eukprot:gene1858-biopygen16879